ncbi:MAG: 4Fe-4S binding protein [Lachnospiraceae bacterium]|nr:4Fe-4S binding protein [Lachnospiraceae bacterium]
MALLTFSKTVLKNLFSEPETLNYPAEPREYPERSRGHIEINIEECIFCGMCMRNCPPRAITVDRAKGTWEINRFDCIQCNYCSQVCPKHCLKIVPGYCTPDSEKKPSVIERPGGPLPVPKPAKRPAKAPVKAPVAAEKTEAKENKKKKYLPAHYYSSNMSPVPHNAIDRCIFCAMCARNCPANAITVDRQNKMWTIDEGRCIDCGLCELNCPRHCLDIKAESNYYNADGSKKPEPYGEDTYIGLSNKKPESTDEAKGDKAAPKKADSSAKIIPKCNVSDCIFCGACAGGCPASAITVDGDSGTWKVDERACLSCGACVSACPQSVISMS